MSLGTFKLSTAMRNHLLATGSLKGAIDGSFVIRVYDDSIAVPGSADDTVSGAVLLCTLSAGGTGTPVNMETAPVSGVLSKASAETWYGTILATGTASFFRMGATTDDDSATTTAKRFQGTVGIVDADFLVSDTAFVIDEEQRADSCNIGMPESA